MAIRTINYTVSAGGISPTTQQSGGIQGDHRVTKLVYTLDSGLISSLRAEMEARQGQRLYYRFDCYDGAGGHIPYDASILELPNGDNDVVLSVWLENCLTCYGGQIRVYLVITLVSEDNGVLETDAELYHFPAVLGLSQKPSENERRNYESMTTLAERAKSAEAVAVLSAEVAEASAKEALEAAEDIKNSIDQGYNPESENAQSGTAVAQAVESFKNVMIQEGTEFVFLGGNAEGKNTVDLAVDTDFSASSENPVQNKVLAINKVQTDKELSNLSRKIDETSAENESINKKLVALDQELVTLKTELLKQAKLDAHPVGSLYWSDNETSPADLFGGSWERIKDRFILAAGDNYDFGATGGEAEHTLTVDEMPQHRHDVLAYCNYGGTGHSVKGKFVIEKSAYVGWSSELRTNINIGLLNQSAYSGYSAPHNNMPPYIAMYCWIRTE